MQIADYFCENILSQKWQANVRIPSVRDIAVAMEVNPNTAMRAFIYLQDKGIIYNKRGIGYFVSEEGYHKALELKRTMFFEKDLPVMLNTMKLLNISLEDIKKFSKEI